MNRSILLKIVILLAITFKVSAQQPNIRISNPFDTDPNEVTIALNPTSPLNLLAGANLRYYYYSNDGGQTWTTNNLQSSLGVAGDPCVLFDVRGIAYYSHLSYKDYWLDRIVVQKSTDGGMTWNDGASVGFDSAKQQDKDWLATDMTDSQFRGNIYVAWTEFDKYGSTNPLDSTRILFSRSTDIGETWSNPVRISDEGGNCLDDDSTVEGAVPAVGPEGQVYISWAGPKGIMFDKSIDGGKTFGKDIFVTTQPGGWAFDVSGINRCNGLPMTACDISNSPYRGYIYIIWSDQRNGTGNTDVFFIRSSDGGKTWNDLRKVNNDINNRQHFYPSIAVDQSNGYIYIVFYDRRNTTGDATDVYLARSIDGGESFSNYRISDSSFIPEPKTFFGDYISIAAGNGSIYPIWMRMDSSKMSVWMSLIKDSVLTNVEKEPLFTEGYKLFQNYPNPFNPSTVISYELSASSNVTLSVYDILGRKVTTLVNGYETAGKHSVNFTAGDLPSGVYFYRIQTETYMDTKKLILLK